MVKSSSVEAHRADCCYLLCVCVWGTVSDWREMLGVETGTPQVV